MKSLEEPLLQTRHLGVHIGQRHVCQDLNLSLLPGQCWAVLGINGAGKTTLLHTLAGLRPSQGGEILIRQQPLTSYARRDLARIVGLLLQDIQDPFPSTVMETALMGRHPYTQPWQWESANDHRLASEALAQVGLQALSQRQINTLSGGERQRLAIAMVLTQEPQLLLLDEPTNHLDLQYQHHVLKLFQHQARENGDTVVMILHDINLASAYCDHALLLFDDEEPRGGSSEELLTEDNLSRLYHYPIRKIDSRDNRTVFIAV